MSTGPMDLFVCPAKSLLYEYLMSVKHITVLYRYSLKIVQPQDLRLVLVVSSCSWWYYSYIVVTFQHFAGYYYHNTTTDSCVCWCIDHYYHCYNCFHFRRDTWSSGLAGWIVITTPYSSGHHKGCCWLSYSNSAITLSLPVVIQMYTIIPWSPHRWVFLFQSVDPYTDILCLFCCGICFLLSGSDEIAVYVNGGQPFSFAVLQSFEAYP